MGRRWTISPSAPWLRHAGAAPAHRQNLVLVDMRVLPVGIDLRQLRRDALLGQVSVEQLLDVIDKQQQTIQRLQRENQRLQDRLAPYEPEVRNEKSPGQAPAETPSSSYSLDAEQKRRRGRRRRKKSPGRRPTELKFADADRTEDIYPDGMRHKDCQLVRERAVWRLEDGRAVRVGYRIFAAPGGQEPRIPGVTPRCEYGIEILVVLAFLVYLIGISLDKACAVLGFFCQLPLAKSQADALLRQLARHWDSEFDILCALIAHAAVVYLDETGWKVGNSGCSLWAFASQWQRLFLFGCRKDDDTLNLILPPDVFDGIGAAMMPPSIAAASRGRRSVGPICSARSSAWRCCTRVTKAISVCSTNSWSCSAMPNGRRRINGWETRVAAGASATWKIGSTICAGPTTTAPRRT